MENTSQFDEVRAKLQGEDLEAFDAWAARCHMDPRKMHSDCWPILPSAIRRAGALLGQSQQEIEHSVRVALWCPSMDA